MGSVHLQIPIDLPMLDAGRFRREGEVVMIFDAVRGKWLQLTPEEFVRQRFVEWLVKEGGYSVYRLGNEIGLTVNRRRRRCDTVVFNADRTPLMVVEYKAPQVRITQKVFDQIVRYNSVLNARYLVVSNGVETYCCEMDYINSSYRYLGALPHAV